MIEKIYTIPINEAFEHTHQNPEEGCPLCRLHAKFEASTLSFCLGGAMMEPDVRIEMNRKGFCPDHLQKLASMKNKLALALILESRLDEIRNDFQMPPTSEKKGLFSPKPSGSDGADALGRASASCFVCDKIRFTDGRYASNTAALWGAEEQFRQTFTGQPFFCVSHAAILLKHAKHELNPTKYEQFYTSLMDIENKYLTQLRENVGRFCVSFDYRNAGKPLGEEKHCIEDALKFLK
ncbi:MAG: hypothetical protein GX111_12670 [Clostridiales bacterium]|jgi:hypothetical protein|nr:hypothetical protein [Clostridiales bacterium]